MIRLLLSLLALVSGLAVQGTPAQARLCAVETEIGAPAPTPTAAHIAVRVAALTVARLAPAGRGETRAMLRPVAQVASRPGVLIRIDRARD